MVQSNGKNDMAYEEKGVSLNADVGSSGHDTVDHGVP
jgi:hypothetical protein